ncbi:hypothetical protein M422DRAFT_32512 [Sphaerobolus stellatus SS14]|uniref:Phosphatidylinositol 4-kinase n=1 Tax=Sphaerobolus stellatus (strain SS14) TaxID=990650 RepID=A0A0C9VQ04_SPHS4|nr:hypothetical protein M422DRAFT_32512 [Sphaerobolus stellatus SS14]
MPINRGDYQPLAQSVEDIEEEDVGLQQTEPSSPTTSRRLGKRPQIDLRTIDTAFKKWTESIAQKVKRKKKGNSVEKVEIAHSVFGPEIPAPPHYYWPIKTLNHKPPMTHEEYEEMTEAVRDAIDQGTHPKMISKGSSGSYFARAKVDGRIQTVGVFKPKDEEPYGRLNPKTTKWVHRQFRWIIPFGRACLIPNLSYISEAAASLLDDRLQLHIVPRTELVTFSSPAFFYDWLDRNAAKKGKPLPGKIGSMQCFLQGYQDASEFLRAHPLPGRPISDTFDDSTHRTGSTSKRFLTAMQVLCGRTGEEELDDEDDDERIYGRDPSMDNGPERFHWTKHLQNEFRDELEKLVILDFLMRNTDRGSDNYMLKYCERSHERTLIDVEPSRSSINLMPVMREVSATEAIMPNAPAGSSTSRLVAPSMKASEHDSASYSRAPHLHLAAIDNSLSFPHEHPKGWRTFTYGWLYLPVSVIGRPFSEKTRNHFLPLLTSKAWWEETTYQLHKLFAVDPDFHPKMFKRQLAVMKGQAWNIVQCLKHADEGPLELTRRQKVLVWDDEVEIPVDGDSANPSLSPVMTPPARLDERRRSTSERRIRSRSFGSFPFPPPMRRSITDTDAGARPVPFAGKFQKINPGASGVRVLEHMERYDEVERGLKKLGMEETVLEEEEEEGDIGVKADPTTAPSQTEAIPKADEENNNLLDEDIGDVEDQHLEALAASTISAPMLSGYSSDEDTEAGDRASSIHESRRETRSLMGHSRATSDDGGRRSFDWARMRRRRQPAPAGKTRTVIVERLETIDTKPFFACW